MSKAFGIVSFASSRIWVDGMQPYRPIGAFSFLGRYRIVDFPISNMTNSGIEHIQVYIKRKPRSLVEHLGTGRHYNINSKSGRMHILFAGETPEKSIYNTDLAAYTENMECIENVHKPYVVIAPSYMVYSADFDALLESHIESNADVTLLYHSVDNAKDNFLNCDTLNLDRDKKVVSIDQNRGTAKNRNIFMDTYIIKKDRFIELIKKGKKLSSMYTLTDIINAECENLDVRGVAHRGYFAAITDFKSFYDANMDLIDYKAANTLFNDAWPIYTRTNDSCPTQYFKSADVKSSVISNGCLIEGTIENSVIGRGCVIKKGATIKNCVILPEVIIDEDVHVENQVVDKHAEIKLVKEVVSPPDHPGYVKREDRL